ncbi:MAG: aspartate carbamoyltransferase catalytic subunit [Phycisphaerae bacterium]|jgi:aspartate carbamoyltransferase catalytic subunit|nr:aspartate carbamoyltransferase catalytic subunit [Phycisphaerae bacterium]
MPWNGRHFLNLDDLAREDMIGLMKRASHFLNAGDRYEPDEPLAGKIIANLFMENSTRTRCSFTIATKRLGGDYIDLLGETSSSSKGESLVDTALNLEAMGVAGIVVRCSEENGPDEIAKQVGVPVINAGSGTTSHPTQALLDAVTLSRYFGTDDLSGQHIAIVGDIAHSRVARSNVIGLKKLGAKVTLVGPPELLPEDLNCETSSDFDSMLAKITGIMMLRVQFERDAQVCEDYREKFGLTEARAANFQGAIMHPGPMNRGLEIDDSVANIESSPHNLILSQVTSGVATRMAILEHLIG